MVDNDLAAKGYIRCALLLLSPKTILRSVIICTSSYDFMIS